MSDRPLGDAVDQEFRRLVSDIATVPGPAPELDELHSPVLTLEKERTMSQGVKYGLIAAVAAAVAIIVGLVLLIDNGDEGGIETIDEPEETTTTTTIDETTTGAAETIADSYLSALVGDDPLSQEGILAEGAVYGDDGRNMTAAAHLLELVWHHAAGGRFWDEQCQPPSQQGDVAVVDCTYQVVEPWNAPLETVPLTGRSILRIGPEGVVSISRSNVDGSCPCIDPEPAAWARVYRPDAVDGIIEATYSTAAEAQETGAAFGELMDEWRAFNERYGCTRVNVATCGPAKVARRYLDARSAHDVDAALSRTDDRTVVTNEPASREALERHIAFEAAVDARIFGVGCTGDSGSGMVSCEYQYENAVSRSLGLGALRGGRFEFDVRDDGVIAELTRVDPIGLQLDVWVPFVDWLGANHPDDIATMIDADGNPITTSEAIELWASYTEEFVAAQG